MTSCVSVPAGGRPGEEVEVRFLGDASGPIIQKIKLPAKACGDICLIPVNPDGEELEFAQPEEQAEVARVLSPHPTHHQLQTLAGQDKVIYVAMGYENDDRRRPQPPARRPATHSKLAITKAILQQSLTRTCILGATLARDLLESP